MTPAPQDNTMSGRYRFGRFEVSPAERQLRVDDVPAALGSRAFDVLLALVEARDRVVSKDELLDRAWPGLVVEENNLQVQVSTLRKLLGPRAIATIPGRGYRFTAVVDDTPSGSQGGIAPDLASAVHDADAAREGCSTNLPAELPPLYGRDADLQMLGSLIESNRLVTVVGAGGIGKSRLALAAAHAQIGRWTDGVWMVELAGLSDPALVPNAVAQTLGIKIRGQDAALDDLVVGVAQRSLLLVLDNCEHLVDAVAALAAGLVEGAPQIRVLATSQEPLRLAVEQQYRLVPLAVPAEGAIGDARDYGAVALFEARVRAMDRRFALTDESLPRAIDICRRLDGLPLAIELAAARVATLGLTTVRDKLDARFKLLTGGSRATLRRHQTLRAALEWSHNLLNDDERTVFRRVGVFAGGFTMEMAHAVAGDDRLDDWTVLEHLSALVDKSLVVADAGDAPRYRLLESARAFALEQLAAGEMAGTLRRHAVAMRDFLERVDGANLDGELRTDQYAAQVLPELDNLRAAYTWATGEAGEVGIAIAIAAHAGSLIDYVVECADWLLPLQRCVEDAAVGDAVAARFWRALTAGNVSGRVSLAVQADAAERAASLYRALSQPRRVFSSLMRLAAWRRAQARDDEARAALDEARALIRPDWPAEFRIILLRRDGTLAREAGRFADALAHYREALRLSASAADWRLEVIARCNLLDLLWEVGPLEDAAREACGLIDALRAKPAAWSDMDVAFTNAMGILSEAGRVDEASAIAREALPIMRRTGRYYVEEWVHLFLRRGQLETATLLLGASDAQQARSDITRQVNEQRLIAKARAALSTALGPDAYARGLAAGAMLGEAELVALIAATLS